MEASSGREGGMLVWVDIANELVSYVCTVQCTLMYIYESVPQSKQSGNGHFLAYNPS